MTRGEEAERRVEERLREALPPAYHLYPNVAWTGPMRDHGPAEDGEADLVIAHPEHGILVLEVKAGEPSRDGAGPLVAGPDPARPLALRAGDAEPEAAGPQARLAAGLAVGARRRSPRRAARRPRRRLPGRRPREPAPGPRAARPRRAARDRPRRDRPRNPGGRPRLGRAGVRLLPRRRRARLAARGGRDAPPRRAPLPHPFDAPARARPDRGRPRGAAPRVPGAGADPQPGSLPPTGGGRRAGRLGQVDAGGREGAAARARGLPDAARLLQPAPCYHATTRAC